MAVPLGGRRKRKKKYPEASARVQQRVKETDWPWPGLGKWSSRE